MPSLEEYDVLNYLSCRYAHLAEQVSAVTGISEDDKKHAMEEASRSETEQAMLLYPWQRSFMERVMPIEWCRERYPKVYAQR